MDNIVILGHQEFSNPDSCVVDAQGDAFDSDKIRDDDTHVIVSIFLKSLKFPFLWHTYIPLELGVSQKCQLHFILMNQLYKI